MGTVAELGVRWERDAVTRVPDRSVPDVTVWEHDGRLDARLGYGDPIARRLAAEGHRVRIVPLVERPPTDEELAARAHVLSGGETPAFADLAWIEAARTALGPVLERALDGEATLTGICLGSQLIAHLLAGPEAVRPHEHGMQGGLTPARLLGVRATGGDPPSTTGAAVVASFHHHRLDRERLESIGARVVVDSERTPVEAFECGVGVRGVQFHPELSPRQLRNVLRRHRSVLRTFGRSLKGAERSVAALGSSWDLSMWERFVSGPVAAAVRPELVA